MRNVERYVNNIVGRMDISRKEKQEYKFQFIDHINSLKEEYMSEGISQEEACDLAIRDFGNDRQILVNEEFDSKLKGNTKFIVRSIFFIYCFILFGHYIKLAGIEGNGGNLVALKSLVPTKTLLGIIHGMAIYGFSNYYIDLILTYIVLFIPLGFLIPLIFINLKSLKKNMKLFTIIALGIQVAKLIFLHKVVNIDFALMNILGCFLGYKIYTLLCSRKGEENG